MKIAINRTHKNKMPVPTPGDWWAKFNGTFENEDCTAADVLAYARWGWSYTAQHADYRKADNFICGQHLDLDLDDGLSPIGDILQDDFIRQNAAFIYETASSSPQEPRLRVFFELDRAIGDAEKYRLLRDSLLHRYPYADKNHRDVCRLAFGAEDANYVWLGNILSLEAAALELVKPYQTSQANSREKQPLNVAIIPQNRVSRRFLEGKLSHLLNKVETAPQGEKYNTLRATAVTLGGYVRAGYYIESEIRQALGDAIRSNPNNVKNLEIADKCIDDALAYGMARPLRIDGRQYQHQTAVVAANIRY